MLKVVYLQAWHDWKKEVEKTENNATARPVQKGKRSRDATGKRKTGVNGAKSWRLPWFSDVMPHISINILAISDVTSIFLHLFQPMKNGKRKMTPPSGNGKTLFPGQKGQTERLVVVVRLDGVLYGKRVFFRFFGATKNEKMKPVTDWLAHQLCVQPTYQSICVHFYCSEWTSRRFLWQKMVFSLLVGATVLATVRPQERKNKISHGLIFWYAHHQFRSKGPTWPIERAMQVSVNIHTRVLPRI